ncbi:DUF5343 domain-containing protein [Candidatus Bathyarchaeota archaeon]|nr:DUF5343 domain-containing protein [Candidatus Bathyarchaeota archaeon]
MVRTRTLKPPIASPSWILDVLGIIRRVKANKIDKEFLKSYNIAKENESKVISALVFLGLIDGKSKKVTEKLSTLRVVGQEYRKNLEKIIKEAYKDAFSEIDLEKAVYQDLINFFIRHYDYSQITGERAARLFLSLCNEAGIPISEDLKKGRRKEEKKRKIRRKEKEAVTRERMIPKKRLPDLHIHLHADTPPELLDKVLSFYEKHLKERR